MRFAWIRQHDGDWPIAWMCAALGVSRSGYYAWVERPPSDRSRRRAELSEHVRRVFDEHGARYGSPRVHEQLADENVTCNVKTVAKLMRENDLYARAKRRFRPSTTDSGHAYPTAPNVLGRRFDQAAPNRAWAADITYVPTAAGWVYLALVVDLFSRRIVGYALADHLRASLAIDALTMALDRRRPPDGSWRDVGLLHHSDRGSQYACGAYQAVLEAHGITCSMSRVGNCYDNAVAESCIGTIKTELVHHEHYPTHAQAIASISDYIDNYYNPQRRHSALGYLSPAEYEQSAA